MIEREEGSIRSPGGGEGGVSSDTKAPVVGEEMEGGWEQVLSFTGAPMVGGRKGNRSPKPGC